MHISGYCDQARTAATSGDSKPKNASRTAPGTTRTKTGTRKNVQNRTRNVPVLYQFSLQFPWNPLGKRLEKVGTFPSNRMHSKSQCKTKVPRESHKLLSAKPLQSSASDVSGTLRMFDWYLHGVDLRW